MEVSVMEIINRYIYAVTKRLRPSQREDIEEELRGLIEDMLAARCAEEEPKKSDINEVLKKLGDPSKLADQYRDTTRYLIGPEYFETYLLVLKIILFAVVFGVTLASTIAVFVNAPLNIAQGLGGFISNIVTSALSAFAWVTIIFAIVERVRSNNDTLIANKEWDPSSLPEIPSKKAAIKKSEPIVGIVFAVLFIILFSLTSQLIGVYHFENGKLTSVTPLFGAGLSRFLPLITVLLCISILKECIKLVVGKWTLSLALANTVLNFIALVFCAVIFTSPDVWNENFIKGVYEAGLGLKDLPVSPETIWSYFTKGFIYIIAFGFIIDSLASIYKSIKYKL
jgi:hypothetical protein